MLSQPLRIAHVVVALVALGTCAAFTDTMQDPDAWAGEAADALEVAASIQRDLTDLRWPAGDGEAWLAALTAALGIDTWEREPIGVVAARLTAEGFVAGRDEGDYGVVIAWLATLQDVVSLAAYDGAIERVPAGGRPAVGWIAPGERGALLVATLERFEALVAPGRP